MTHEAALDVADPAAEDGRTPSRSLIALLGRTRAEILGHVAEGGRTTTEPARSTGMTPATVGHHATVLRDAGLLSTHRLGGAGLTSQPGGSQPGGHGGEHQQGDVQPDDPGFTARYVDHDAPDLDQDETDRRGDGEHGRDSGQRRQDQARRTEDLQRADAPDDRHGDAVDPPHHRPELLLALQDLLASGIEIEHRQQHGEYPESDVHTDPQHDSYQA